MGWGREKACGEHSPESMVTEWLNIIGKRVCIKFVKNTVTLSFFFPLHLQIHKNSRDKKDGQGEGANI